jgi:hypothetical protein
LNKVGQIAGEIGSERTKGGLLKTGQTTQYGGYLDDGYYQKGLSKLYTILTLGQYAGTTSITINSKTDAHSNNCVYDQRTKLMWSRYVAGSVGPGSDGKLPWTTNENGEGIFAYLAAANAAFLAGYSDWRIPNDLELLSLRTMQYPNAKPNATAFPIWPTDSHVYTSTSRADVVASAMDVLFSSGYLGYDTKTVNRYATLVRGG